MRPTMTLYECAEAMRDAGFRIAETTIADAIESGRYSFGKVIRTGKTGRRTIEIFRVDFERWLEERT